MTPKAKKRIIRIVVAVSIGGIILGALWLMSGTQYDFAGLGKIYSSRRTSWESVRGQKIHLEEGFPGPESRNLPETTLSLNTTLADKSYIGVDILVKTKTADEIRRIERRAERIQFAFYLSVNAYKADQLSGKNKKRTLSIVEEILNKQLKIPVEKAYIIRFDLKPSSPS